MAVTPFSSAVSVGSRCRIRQRRYRILIRSRRLINGRRGLTILRNLDRIRASIVLIDRCFGAFGHPQAYPVAGLTALIGLGIVLIDTDAVALSRLGDGSGVTGTTGLANADAVLGESSRSREQRTGEWKESMFHDYKKEEGRSQFY